MSDNDTPETADPALEPAADRFTVAEYLGGTEVIMRGNGIVNRGDLVVAFTRELEYGTGRTDMVAASRLEDYKTDQIGDLCRRLGVPPAEGAKKADLVAAAEIALQGLNRR